MPPRELGLRPAVVASPHDLILQSTVQARRAKAATESLARLRMGKRSSTKRRAKVASGNGLSRPTASQAIPPDAPRRSRFWIVGGGALVVAAVVLLFGNRWVAGLANDQARQELAAQHVDEAIEWLQWSLKWYEQSVETNLKLSRAYRRRGRFARCQEYLDRARELGLSDERYERERVLIRAQQGVMRREEMGRQLAVLLSDPDDDAVEISESFTNGYLVNQRYTEAMQLLDAWHLDYPDDAQPHYLRGIIWRRLGSLDAAESEIRRALALQPTHYPAAMELGDFLVQHRSIEEALPYFEMCAAATHEGTMARVRAAQCLRLLGMHDEARARIEGVLAENSDMLAALVELAQGEIAAGEYASAIPRLERGAAEDPRNTEIRSALATALEACGRSDEAQEHFDFVHKAKPAVSRARELIAGLNDEPGSAATRTEIGRLLIEYGSEFEGVFWLRSALTVDLNYKPAHETLATYFERHADQYPDAAAATRYHRRMAEVDDVDPTQENRRSSGAPQAGGDTPSQREIAAPPDRGTSQNSPPSLGSGDESPSAAAPPTAAPRHE